MNFRKIADGLTLHGIGLILATVLMVFPLTYLITGDWFFAAPFCGMLVGFITVRRLRKNK